MIFALTIAPSSYLDPISIVADPIYLSTYTVSGTGNTSSYTITPSGGDGSYTYEWTIEDGDITANSPTAAVCSFHFVNIADPGEAAFCTVKCTVRDGSGNSGYIILGVTIVRES